MNKSNKNIESYFVAAKDQEPLLDNSEVLDILDRSDLSGNKISRTIIGMKPMNFFLSTVAAAAAVGVVSYNTIDFKSEDDEQQPVKTTNQTQVVKTEPVLEELPYVDDLAINTNTLVSNQFNFEEQKNIFEHEKISVNGIKTIRLTQDELKKIGVLKDGDVFTFQAFAESPMAFAIDLKKDDYNINHDMKKSEALPYEPKFVTNSEGDRLISLFSGENHLGAQWVSKGQMIDKMNSDEEFDLQEMLKNLNITLEKDLKTTMIELKKTLKNVNHEVDSVIKMINVQAIIDSSMDIAKMKLEDIDIPNIIMEDGKIKIINSEGVIEIFDEEEGTLEVDGVKKKVKVMKFGTDSNIEINSDDNVSENSIAIMVQKNDNDVEVEKHITVDVLKDDEEKLVVKLDNGVDGEEIEVDLFDSFAQGNINDYVRINKLVPIEIRFDESSENYDYLIWFDPSIEFIENLPSDIAQKLAKELDIALSNDFCENSAIAGDDTYFDIWHTCSESIKDMSVFPNPASAELKVKFKLDADKDIKITLHDVFGKRIKDLTEVVKFYEGSYLEVFDINVEPGMYIVVIQTADGEQVHQRLIVE